jgi:TonB family protein
VRVPGTTLRFGLADTVISARGFTAAGPGARKGPCRFFGLTSDATLTLEGGRLARAEFAVDSASTYEIDYVHDQLTAMGYRKSCGRPTPKTEVCDWTARTNIRIEVSGTRLKASVVPASAAAVTPRGTVPDTGSGAARRALAPPAGPPAPVRTATRDTARNAAPVAGAVPVSPETLAVSVPGRASRYEPATLLSRPRCPYPDASREAGIQGRVWVLALVDTDGRVIRAQLKSGIPALNAAALACVRDWSFKPVVWQGAPCRCWVLVPVTLTLD